MKFIKPDEKTIKRMTVRTISILLETLKDQRAEVVKPFDEQIKYYENLMIAKQKEADNAQTTGTI